MRGCDRLEILGCHRCAPPKGLPTGVRRGNLPLANAVMPSSGRGMTGVQGAWNALEQQARAPGQKASKLYRCHFVACHVNLRKASRVLYTRIPAHAHAHEKTFAKMSENASSNKTSDSKTEKEQQEPEVVKFSPQEEAVRTIPARANKSIHVSKLTRETTGATRRVQHAQVRGERPLQLGRLHRGPGQVLGRHRRLPQLPRLRPRRPALQHLGLPPETAGVERRHHLRHRGPRQAGRRGA